MNYEHGFVTYLESLQDNRAALAALRRGLGQPPGTVPDTFRYVVPRLPPNAYPGSWTEQTYYLIASLYALHPDSTPMGNLGDHFAETLDPNPDHNDAIERRFTALLTAHSEDLHIYLRQGISFFKSKETPVNWHRLMWDVLALGKPDRAPTVQKYWANSFWRYNASDSDKSDTDQSATD